MSFRIKLITTWTLWSHYHYVQVLVSQFCPTLCDSCSPPGSSVQGHSPGTNIGVGCHALLQGIFPTQESNPGLPSCRQILYHLSHQGSPRILVWVAYPFSRGSSRFWNWTRVSSIAGGFFTSWATREAPKVTLSIQYSKMVILTPAISACSPRSLTVTHTNSLQILWILKIFWFWSFMSTLRVLFLVTHLMACKE